MLIKDHWYVACPSDKLTTNQPYSFQVYGQHFVAFRDENGIPAILEDRCCHRGVPLSLGRVRKSMACQTKGVISCRYHGWEFDREGKVVHIPAHNRPGEDNFRVKAFHCTEAENYVWV